MCGGIDEDVSEINSGKVKVLFEKFKFIKVMYGTKRIIKVYTTV